MPTLTWVWLLVTLAYLAWGIPTRPHGIPFVFLLLYFKYHTLKYAFDDKGVSMSWGILFHREIYLTYRRIQDIHVTRNIFHRWLGLAAVSVQTASGSAGAEMTIEGIRNPEALRDFGRQATDAAPDSLERVKAIDRGTEDRGGASVVTTSAVVADFANRPASAEAGWLAKATQDHEGPVCKGA